VRINRKERSPTFPCRETQIHTNRRIARLRSRNEGWCASWRRSN